MRKYLLILLLFSTSYITAQIATEGAVTVDKKTFRVENITILNIDNYSHEKLWDFNNLLRFGVLKGLEFRIGHDYFISRYLAKNGYENISGFGDMNAGLKVQLFKSKKEDKFNLALMSTVNFPTGAQAFSSNNFNTNHLFLLSNAITDDFGIEYNFGYQEGDEKGDLIYTLSGA